MSQAVSSLSGPVVGVVSGSAYGTYASVGDVVVSGPTFKVSMPCLGTGGALRTNTGAGIDIDPVLETGTITNTAKGTVTATSATAETTSTVQTVDLLDGLVEATAIKAKAKVTRSGTNYVVTNQGSSFGSLSVDGHPLIGPDVAPDTRVTLDGIGSLRLNRVVRSEKTVVVIMMQLVLSEPLGGLAPGTVINVGVASAKVS